MLIPEIIFNSGGTEGNNTVLHSAVQHFHQQRSKLNKRMSSGEGCALPHIVTSNVEHDSIKNVLHHYERQQTAGTMTTCIMYFNISLMSLLVSSLHNYASTHTCILCTLWFKEVTYVPVSNRTGRLEVDDVIAALRPNTCLITVMLANNETGIIMVWNLLK